MLTKSLKNNSASKLLVASALAVLFAGTGAAATQIADDPPGFAFQDHGIRESDGYSVFEGVRQLPRAATGRVSNALGSYAAALLGVPLRQQTAVHHNGALQNHRDQRISEPIYFRLARGRNSE